MAAAPPRSYNKFGDLANWVHMFNKDLQDLAARTNCGFIRAAPLHPKFYKPDGIHFTEEGVKDYAQRVVGLINHEWGVFGQHAVQPVSNITQQASTPHSNSY